jgi:hypothetical protein
MKYFVSTALLSALLTGCASSNTPTDILAYQTPIEPQIGIRDTHHHNIIGEYNHRDAVDPKSWRKLNDDQAPKPGAGS